jgi:hypothetical protein
VQKIKGYVITGILCFILGSAVVGGLVYRSGVDRARQLGGELAAAADSNRQLAGQLEQREALVNQLAEDNRSLTESIEYRQGIIDAAKRELESSRSSIAKIRALLELLRNTE